MSDLSKAQAFLRTASAAELGDRLGKGMDPNACDEEGVSPLTWVVTGGNVEAVRVLLAAGADVHHRGPDDWTALHAAAGPGGHPEVVRLLLDAGADPDGRAMTGTVPLHQACQAVRNPEEQKDRAEIVRLLLDAGAATDVIEYEEDGGNHSPVDVAALTGNRAALEVILKDEVGKGQSSHPGDALHLAVERERLETVIALLDAGADPDVLETSEGISPLHRAVGNGRSGWIMRALLEGGASLDSLDDRGRTPLHEAAAESQSGGMGLQLLSEGARADVRCEQGRTALHEAARSGASVELVGALLAHGTEADARDSMGETPLLLVAERRLGADAVAIADLLLARGADPGAKARDGNTPLHRAALRGGAAMVARLVDAGADIDAVNVKGQTPMHCAAEAGVLDRVVRLMDAGADISARDHGWQTPLHHAARHGHFPVVRRLLAGVSNDLHTADRSGATPMDLLGRLGGGAERILEGMADPAVGPRPDDDGP